MYGRGAPLVKNMVDIVQTSIKVCLLNIHFNGAMLATELSPLMDLSCQWLSESGGWADKRIWILKGRPSHAGQGQE